MTRDWKAQTARREQRVPVERLATLEAPDFRAWLERPAELEPLDWKDLTDSRDPLARRAILG